MTVSEDFLNDPSVKEMLAEQRAELEANKDKAGGEGMFARGMLAFGIDASNYVLRETDRINSARKYGGDDGELLGDLLDQFTHIFASCALQIAMSASGNNTLRRMVLLAAFANLFNEKMRECATGKAKAVFVSKDNTGKVVEETLEGIIKGSR